MNNKQLLAFATLALVTLVMALLAVHYTSVWKDECQALTVNNGAVWCITSEFNAVEVKQ